MEPILKRSQQCEFSETGGRANANQSLGRYVFHPRFFSVIAALAYIGIVNLLLDYSDVFEFDPDEGNNLIKALLLDRGFVLGAQIWTDQAPGFTYLLWGAFEVFGWSVEVARQTVLFFAGIAVFVVYDAVRSSSRDRCGHPAAIAGCTILLFSTLFTQLSVSVMIGLPAIAMMMIAVWSLNEYLQSRRQYWLAISGALMGFSVGIKLFTAFLVPVYAVFLVVHIMRNDRTGCRHFPVITLVLLLSGFLASLLICLSPVVLHGSVSELLEPHLAIRMSEKGDSNGLGPLLGFVRQDGFMFALALLGTFQALKTRERSMYLWILWLFPAVIVLYDHSPVWGHHRLLLTLPGAILAGYALGGLLSIPTRNWPRVFRPGWVIVATIAMAGLLVSYPSSLRERLLVPSSLRDRSLRERKAQRVIESYLPETSYIVSSRQIFAFRANRPVPPNLAVTSKKRIRSGWLTGEDIIEGIRANRPEMIILNDRWGENITKAVRGAINEEYELVYQDKSIRNLEIWILKVSAKGAAR